MDKHPRERRLTCNRIFRHLTVFERKGFTGQLGVPTPDHTGAWTFHIIHGRLLWATGGEHPTRRWMRQVALATGKRLNPTSIRAIEEGWDYRQLCRLAEKKLTPEQVRRILRGMTSEVLFDVVQAYERPLASEMRSRGSLVSVSVLDGVGDGLSVEPEAGGFLFSEHRFPQSWLPELNALQRETQAAWQTWVELGLADISPDRIPFVRDRAALRANLGTKTFENLTTLLDGKRTFRDVAIKCLPHRDLLRTARPLASYLQSGWVSAVPGEDLLAGGRRQIVVCASASRHTYQKLATIAAERGMRCEWIQHGTEMLERLSKAERPDSIFLDTELPLFAGIELRGIARRLKSFARTPIYVFSEHPGDRKQARAAEKAEATAFLCGSDLDMTHLKSLFGAGRPEGSDARSTQWGQTTSFGERTLSFLTREMSFG